MKDLRIAFNKSWQQAKESDGDFQDFLLHYLSINLGMPVLNDVSYRETDEGIEEMTRGTKPSVDACEAKINPNRGAND